MSSNVRLQVSQTFIYPTRELITRVVQYIQITAVSNIKTCKGKGKGKVHHRIRREDPEGEQIYNSTLPSTSELYGGWVVNANHRPLYPRKDTVPIV